MLTDEIRAGLHEACFYMKENYLLELANKGDVNAQFLLAEIYYYNDLFDRAYEWFQKAAENGYADALCYIARYYHRPDGFGVVESSDEKTLEYYNKAIDAGSADAMYDLGYYGYMSGLYCERDERKGIELLTRSAELGCSDAYRFLAICYRRGNGVEKKS